MATVSPIFTAIDLDVFGNERKTTSVLLKELAQNTQWLYTEVDKLWDSTDPELRTVFKPPAVDDIQSYGVVLDVDKYKFDDRTLFGFTDPLVDDTYIDKTRTTAYLNLAGTEMKIPYSLGASTQDVNTAGVTVGFNQFWHVGWDRVTPFSLNPEWLLDRLLDKAETDKMPSVCRCQSFTPTMTGVLEKVFFYLNGKGNAEDDLFVEIRTMTSNSGYPTGVVIAREKVEVNQYAGFAQFAVKFQHPPKLTSGTKYAFVIRSPFTSWNHRFGLGGWGVNCQVGKSAGGEAFTSFDGGRTWRLYGVDDAALPYREGSIRPRDFALTTFMKSATVHIINTNYYVYWKAIRCNPATKVHVSPSQTTPAGTTITWEVSATGRSNDWHAVDGVTWDYEFPTPTKVVYVRATLRTTIEGNSPSIQGLDVDVTCEKALDAYLRTKFFSPQRGDMLGASLWDEVDAPFEYIPPNDPDINITVDIIGQSLVEEDFDTTSGTTELQLTKFLPAKFIGKIVYESSSHVVSYLYEDKDFLVDYDTGLISFIVSGVVQTGQVKVSYNPIIIKGLTDEEFPFRLDIQEDIFIGDGTQNEYKLRMFACQPLREISIDDIPIVENSDCSMNYQERLFNNISLLDIGEELKVKYTPHIVENGLALGYHMTRGDYTKQAYIHPYYFQVRV